MRNTRTDVDDNNIAKLKNIPRTNKLKKPKVAYKDWRYDTVYYPHNRGYS